MWMMYVWLLPLCTLLGTRSGGGLPAWGTFPMENRSGKCHLRSLDAGDYGQEVNEKAKELLHIAGLEGFEDEYPMMISSGMQRR